MGGRERDIVLADDSMDGDDICTVQGNNTTKMYSIHN